MARLPLEQGADVDVVELADDEEEPARDAAGAKLEVDVRRLERRLVVRVQAPLATDVEAFEAARGVGVGRVHEVWQYSFPYDFFQRGAVEEDPGIRLKQFVVGFPRVRLFAQVRAFMRGDHAPVVKERIGEQNHLLERPELAERREIKVRSHVQKGRGVARDRWERDAGCVGATKSVPEGAIGSRIVGRRRLLLSLAQRGRGERPLVRAAAEGSAPTPDVNLD